MDWKFIVTIVVAVAGIAVSTILVIKLSKRKKPVWAYVSWKIIGLGTNAPHELKLIFNDEPVNDVHQTLVIFFNAGNEAIVKEDVRDNIDIRFPGAKILREPILRMPNKPQTKLSAGRLTENGCDLIRLDFEFLDHNDGIVLDVLHTACNAPIDCSGYILETGKPRYIGEFIPRQYKFTKSRIRNYVMAILGPLAFSGLMIFVDLRDGDFPNIWNYIVFPLFFWALALMEIMPDTLKRLRFPSWSKQ